MNITKASIVKEDTGNCRICNEEGSPRAHSNKLGIARTLPGLSFFSGYFCEGCLKAAQFGFQFGYEVGQSDAKKKEEIEDTEKK